MNTLVSHSFLVKTLKLCQDLFIKICILINHLCMFQGETNLSLNGNVKDEEGHWLGRNCKWNGSSNMLSLTYLFEMCLVLAGLWMCLFKQPNCRDIAEVWGKATLTKHGGRKRNGPRITDPFFNSLLSITPPPQNDFHLLSWLKWFDDLLSCSRMDICAALWSCTQ